MAKPIGQILVEQGAITHEQLKKALEEQRVSKQKKRIGEILIDLAIIDETDIASALSSQFGFPYLSTKNITFSRDICAVIPRNLVEQYHLVPIDKINNILYIIMADPSDEKAIQEIEKVSNCKVQTFISTASEIQSVIEKEYGQAA